MDRSLCVKKLFSGTIQVFSVKEKDRCPELREALNNVETISFYRSRSCDLDLNSLQTESGGQAVCVSPRVCVV